MHAIVGKTIGWLRDADWLTRDRATAYVRILFFVTLGAALLWVALAQGGVDRAGKPLGTDFVSFWTASKIALSGHPAEVYDIPTHLAAQNALFPRSAGYVAFFYPPTFLLLCLPLATLPYLWSLSLWLSVTGFACWRAIRGWLGKELGALPILAFPAMLANLGHGQNAFLSAALFGGGALMLEARPFVAGVCLGALVFKPHLAIVVPVALVAARRWRAVLGAAVSAAGFCLASLAAFGPETWQAFLAASPKAKIAMEQNMVGDEKMQSVFAAARLLHGGLTLAYGLQAAATLAVCAALVALQFRAFRSKVEGPAMIAAALLASPFLLDYDLVLLAFPLAFLVREGLRVGFRPYEKIILVAAFILPAVSRSIAGHLGLPLGPIVIAAVLMLVMRRAGERAPLRARVGADLRNAQGALSPAAQTMIEIA
jgi:alpha-1,2-mannosyltransferase